MHSNWKGRGKMSLYADDMTLYIENPNDCTQNPLKLINSAKQEDAKLIHRNLLHFFTLTMNYQKGKVKMILL